MCERKPENSMELAQGARRFAREDGAAPEQWSSGTDAGRLTRPPSGRTNCRTPKSFHEKNRLPLSPAIGEYEALNGPI